MSRVLINIEKVHENAFIPAVVGGVFELTVAEAGEVDILTNVMHAFQDCKTGLKIEVPAGYALRVVPAPGILREKGIRPDDSCLFFTTGVYENLTIKLRCDWGLNDHEMPTGGEVIARAFFVPVADIEFAGSI